jgi:DNA replication and repair protein RecF
MAVLELRVHHLRCLDDVQIEPDARLNVISGANGAGKTSVLEAIYLLGRGRSFRAPRLASVVQSGQKEASLFVRVQDSDKTEHRLGLSVQKTRTEARLNGDTGASGADLIATLPVQLIDPQIHELIQGGPAERRRFLDWGVFHVKHEFRMAWARYRRALSQRNAALRQALDSEAVQAWDADLLAAAESIDQCRQEYLQEVTGILASTTQQLLDLPTTFTYQRGWNADKDLSDVLRDGLDRDRAMGSTQAGPHRAELQIIVDEHPARHRLSRGQQKLCAAALVLGQGKFVIQTSQRDLALLVDEPAAELDTEHLARLFQAIQELGAQVFITALDPEALGLSGGGRVFHVERGKVANLV